MTGHIMYVAETDILLALRPALSCGTQSVWLISAMLVPRYMPCTLAFWSGYPLLHPPLDVAFLLAAISYS